MTLNESLNNTFETVLSYEDDTVKDRCNAQRASIIEQMEEDYAFYRSDGCNHAEALDGVWFDAEYWAGRK